MTHRRDDEEFTFLTDDELDYIDYMDTYEGRHRQADWERREYIWSWIKLIIFIIIGTLIGLLLAHWFTPVFDVQS